MLIGSVNVEKLTSSHKIALNIMHTALYFALVPRCTRSGRTDYKTVVLCHTPVGFAKDWIVDQRFHHRCFQIVGYNPSGNAAPALKGASMQADPGRCFLVKDQFCILMAAVAQGGDKGVGPPQPTAEPVFDTLTIQWTRHTLGSITSFFNVKLRQISF
jgi:hypothetical protein